MEWRETQCPGEQRNASVPSHHTYADKSSAICLTPTLVCVQGSCIEKCTQTGRGVAEKQERGMGRSFSSTLPDALKSFRWIYLVAGAFP